MRNWMVRNSHLKTNTFLWFQLKSKSFEKSHQIVRNSDILMRISHDEMTKLSSFSKKVVLGWCLHFISNSWELYCIKLRFSLLVWHHRQKLKWWSKSCILFTDAFQMLRHCLVPCLLSVHQYKIEEGGLAMHTWARDGIQNNAPG